MTDSRLQQYFDAHAEALYASLGRVFGTYRAKIDTLETRIKQLESRPLLKWGGVYEDGKAYGEAQLVTRSGSLWVSTAATDSTPGVAGGPWRLIVKGQGR